MRDLSKPVKVLQHNGQPHGISEVQTVGGALLAIAHSASGSIAAHELTQAEYDALPEDGELGEAEMEWVSPPEDAGKKIRVHYLKLSPSKK